MLTTNIPRRIATVMAVTILLCLMAFGVAVETVRGRIDARDAAGSVRLMGARLDDLRKTLATTAEPWWRPR